MRPASRNASGMRLGPFTALLIVGSVGLAPAPAGADDVWTNVHPGIDHLHRIDGSQIVHAVVVDMSRPEMWLRATRDGERGQTATAFAQSVGAAVAINGDFYLDGYQPRGLAIGAGEVWAGSVDLVDHCFFACTLERRCTFDTWGTVAWTDPEWRNAVGANGDPLVENGLAIIRAEAFYDSDRHPRSAVGMSQDQRTLILAVVQGRRADSAGMTFNETAELMAGLGAWNALMLDGGGSSALVIDGGRVSDLPTGSGERVVANHLAVMRTDPIDARCAGIENQRACVDATVLQTCEGGNYSEGDCGFFGATCEEIDGHGVCVDPRCTRGPSGHFCLDGTVIAGCTRGAYGEGDCGAFGTTCEDTGGDAFCVDPRCTRGGMGKVCISATVLASCDRGAYAEGDCAAYGAACEDTGEDAFCVDPRCAAGGNGAFCADADLLVACDRGAYAEARCSDQGKACAADAAACVDPACLEGGERTWCDGPVAWRCQGGLVEREDCTARAETCLDGSCRSAEDGEDAGPEAPSSDAGPDVPGADGGLEGCDCRIAGPLGTPDRAAALAALVALAGMLVRARP
ncbi:MAG: phosphodiester glycosidase family protein [Deltaproteobacteria bacterium]|nr:phosphodiester glycosidase family protein [Deltaproteobacteria bacterium]